MAKDNWKAHRFAGGHAPARAAQRRRRLVPRCQGGGRRAPGYFATASLGGEREGGGLGKAGKGNKVSLKDARLRAAEGRALLECEAADRSIERVAHGAGGRGAVFAECTSTFLDRQEARGLFGESEARWPVAFHVGEPAVMVSEDADRWIGPRRCLTRSIRSGL